MNDFKGKDVQASAPSLSLNLRHPAGQTVDGTAPSLPSLEAKWTPGPWVVETPRDRDDADRDWSEKHPYGVAVRSHWEPPRNAVAGYEVCIMSGMSHETLANARLIAAAPELYAALKALEGIIYCVDGLTKVEWREEAEAARAALAKAEGNS